MPARILLDAPTIVAGQLYAATASHQGCQRSIQHAAWCSYTPLERQRCKFEGVDPWRTNLPKHRLAMAPIRLTCITACARKSSHMFTMSCAKFSKRDATKIKNYFGAGGANLEKTAKFHAIASQFHALVCARRSSHISPRQGWNTLQICRVPLSGSGNKLRRAHERRRPNHGAGIAFQ